MSHHGSYLGFLAALPAWVTSRMAWTSIRLEKLTAEASRQQQAMGGTTPHNRNATASFACRRLHPSPRSSQRPGKRMSLLRQLDRRWKGGAVLCCVSELEQPGMRTNQALKIKHETLQQASLLCSSLPSSGLTGICVLFFLIFLVLFSPELFQEAPKSQKTEVSRCRSTATRRFGTSWPPRHSAPVFWLRIVPKRIGRQRRSTEIQASKVHGRVFQAITSPRTQRNCKANELFLT